MLGRGAIESITKHHSYDQKHKHSLDQHPRQDLYVGLPPNPKQWNTDELTTYLETSSRSGNSTDGAKDDPSLVDILEYVCTRGLTGRELLRLTDADLARYVARAVVEWPPPLIVFTLEQYTPF